MTGASVQVATDPLPGSTERLVTVNGSRDEVTWCIYNICCAMIESPAKGTTIQYEPGQDIDEGGKAGEKCGARKFINGILEFGRVSSELRKNMIDVQFDKDSIGGKKDKGWQRDKEYRRK